MSIDYFMISLIIFSDILSKVEVLSNESILRTSIVYSTLLKISLINDIMK